MHKPFPAFIAAYLALSALAVWWTYQTALQRDLSRLAQTGQLRVDQAAERLINQLDAYRVLTNLLARDPRVAATIAGNPDPEATASLLKDNVLTFGAERVEILNRSGIVVASSDDRAGRISRQGSPLLAAALNGRLGRGHVLEAGQRQFRFSRGILVGAAPPAGAVIVSVNVAELEFEWTVIPEAIGFFDDDGVVVASNRTSLLLRQDAALGERDDRFAAFPEGIHSQSGAFHIQRFPNVADLPRIALVVSRDAPRIGLTVRGFLDTAPARSAAILSALLAAAAAAVMGLTALAVLLWRRRLSDRLAIEAAANARLEIRVEERTAELRATQDQLIQASKMTALGQMSAGISHELNQPLGAILNYSENGERLIERDRPADAGRNFAQISEQVRRIDRIVRNLRGFARNEAELLEPVDLVQSTREALALSETALRKANVTLTTDLPETAVIVRGGKVRLQQVVVNVLTNAIDAVAEQDDPRIDIALQCASGAARLTISDNGHGIADTTRVFEPFYSTKEMGASKGLGLGLSISYGIIGSFGGELSARNAQQGGAEFEIALPLINTEQEA